MLRSRLDKEPILKFLFENSSLTQAQLDTYLIEHATADEKMKLKQKLAMRDRKNVSGGAFIRTLRQAETNIKRTIYNLILFQYLGLIDDKATAEILHIGNILKKAENIESKEKIEEVKEIIETIIDMLSKKKRK
ncbi:MAG: hypothetical protein QXF43_02905 [Nitrososphaerales archaeon]